MSTSADTPDQDLDPTEFVARIRKLGEERDQQDNERLRKLEQDIIQGREERAARRAERQRSISPEKQLTPRSARSSRHTPVPVEDKVSDKPGLTMSTTAISSSRDDALHRLAGTSSRSPDRSSELSSTPTPRFAKPANETAGSDEAAKPSSPSPGLQRSGTLSWNQRPKSRAGRPLSVVAAENNIAKSPTPEPSAADDIAPSRSSIAQSLGSKDPSWFKQTADRGIGSAAYRKSQVEDQDTVDVTRHSQDSSGYRPRSTGSPSLSGRRQLPGLSRESTAEPEHPASPPPESLRSNSPQSSARGSTSWSNRMSTNTSVSAMSSTETKSALPQLDSQRFAPPSADRDGREQNDLGRTYAMSPAQGRISPERMDRPVSPTKGFGGFVQSAMLKRSDSQNKRWSVQTGTGLKRTDSTASNNSRTGSGLGSVGMPSFEARPSTLSRDNSLEPSSRPSSSHSNMTITQDAEKKTDEDGFTKPMIPYHNRARSVASVTGEPRSTESSPPPSPSKRWSPTKSSWLESALKKPDAPKAKPVAPVQQPSWMAEINKAKAQRGGAEPTKFEPTKPETRPLSAKPLTLRGKPPAFDADTTESQKELEVENDAEKKEATGAPAPKAKPSRLSSDTYAPKEEDVAPKPVTDVTPKKTPTPAPKPAPVASPGKIDFRSQLRSRQQSSDPGKSDEPEFKAAFGKLKRAETKNYVAPDTFKENILRGKGALEVTGGPRPYVKKDEFKDDLLKKKGEMKEEVSRSGSLLGKKAEATPEAVPEALARKKTLSQKSIDISKFQKEKPAESTPEAIARVASLKDKPKPVPASRQEKSPELEEPKQPAFGVKSSKLADRFNPALAGMLARGPAPQKEAQEPKATSPTLKRDPTRRISEAAAPAKELTHMTKSRAKGPKRRAPASKSAAATADAGASEESKAEPEEGIEEMVAPKPVSPVSARSTPKSHTARVPSVSLVRPQHVLRSNADEAMQPTIPATKSSHSPHPMSTTNKLDGGPRSPEMLKKAEKPVAPEKSPSLAEKTKSPIASPRQSQESFAPAKPASITNRFSKDVDSRPAETPAPVVQETSGRTSPTKSVLDRFSKNLEAHKTAASRTARQEESRAEEAGRISPTKVAFNRFSMQDKPPISTPQKTETQSATPVKPAFTPKVEQQRKASPVISPKPASIFSPKPASTTSSKAESVKSPSMSQNSPDLAYKKPRPSEEQAVDDLSGVSVRKSSALWGRSSGSSSPSLSRVKDPIKLPTRADERAREEDAGLHRNENSKGSIGLGLGGLASNDKVSSFQLSRNKFPVSPPIGNQPSSVKNLSIDSAKSNAPPTDTSIFAGRFDTPPDSSGQLPPHIDIEKILSSSPVTIVNARTLRNQIWEISPEGTLSPIPIQQENVLFEESMYISAHFSSADDAPPSTEVFLWIGVALPESIVEDVSPAARQFAKQNGAKDFTLVHQGREPPGFVQSLDILVTRRGTRETANERYMLCGRRQFGHHVFDEVDFSLSSLCSGFAYIVCPSQAGPIYLWKGVGCTAEEVSAARLTIGMNLSSSARHIEIEEKSEPGEFMALFPQDSRRPPAAEYWHHKANCERYRTRLFRVEHVVEEKTGFMGGVANLLNPSKLLGTRRPSWQNFKLSMPGSGGAANSNSGTASPTRANSPTPSHSPPPRTAGLPGFLSINKTGGSQSGAANGDGASTPKGTTRVEVREISPFTQSDLEGEAISILDAFFEIYIIIPPLSAKLSDPFAAALLFTQTYAILAPSHDDRPFMPSATVVLEGVPENLRACFRRWDMRQGVGGTEGLMGGSGRRGRGMGEEVSVVGLGTALRETGGG